MYIHVIACTSYDQFHTIVCVGGYTNVPYLFMYAYMHRHNSLSLDVKMDWCDTTVNGQKLDPHIVYKNMVSE